MGINGRSIRFMESWTINRRSATSAASLFRLECDANAARRQVMGFALSIGHPCHNLSPSMSGQPNASKIGLSITHIRINDRPSSEFDIWQYVGLAAAGVCGQRSRLFGMPSWRRVKPRMLVGRRTLQLTVG